MSLGYRIKNAQRRKKVEQYAIRLWNALQLNGTNEKTFSELMEDIRKTKSIGQKERAVLYYHISRWEDQGFISSRLEKRENDDTTGIRYFSIGKKCKGSPFNGANGEHKDDTPFNETIATPSSIQVKISFALGGTKYEMTVKEFNAMKEEARVVFGF